MQVADCYLRLSCDKNNVLLKRNTTPAEVTVLRAIHGVAGEDPIQKIEIHTEDYTRTNQSEYERLKEAYGGAKDGDENSIFGKMYPNVHSANFPREFSEIGFDAPTGKLKKITANGKRIEPEELVAPL